MAPTEEEVKDLLEENATLTEELEKAYERTKELESLLEKIEDISTKR